MIARDVIARALPAAEDAARQIGGYSYQHCYMIRDHRRPGGADKVWRGDRQDEKAFRAALERIKNEARADAILAALVEAGPTVAMVLAAIDRNAMQDGETIYHGVYRAMLAAAQEDRDDA